METRKPIIVVTRKLLSETELYLKRHFDTRFNITDIPMSENDIINSTEGADVLVPTVTDRVTAHLIRRLPESVKLIANFGVGVNHIDIAAAVDRKIIVTNTPGVLTDDTADLTVCLLLAVPRRLTEGERLLRSGEWQGWAPTSMIGHRFSGKKLGIIGMGRIGQAVAHRVQNFGIEVHYHNRNRVDSAVEKKLRAQYWKGLNDMLSRMDYVSVNCPYTQRTHHLLDEARLRLMQPHAFLINTARGEIVDEKVLAKLISEGVIAGAGLDVYEDEPRVANKLLKLENVVLAPHLGSATFQGRLAMGDKVIENIQSFLNHQNPPDRVCEALSKEES